VIPQSSERSQQDTLIRQSIRAANNRLRMTHTTASLTNFAISEGRPNSALRAITSLRGDPSAEISNIFSESFGNGDLDARLLADFTTDLFTVAHLKPDGSTTNHGTCNPGLDASACINKYASASFGDFALNECFFHASPLHPWAKRTYD
ncbi:hypothetical protein PFISCL1PPCAC_4033, partial [Pristionchus fissidentatus]